MNIDDNTHRKNERLFYIRMNISATRLDKELKKGEIYDVNKCGIILDHLKISFQDINSIPVRITTIKSLQT